MRRALLVLLTLVIVYFGFAAWCMNAPAIPYEKMAKMHVGMAAGEVLELLGAPQSRFFEGNGSERWVYSRHTWAMYKVWIEADQTVTNYEHDF